MGKNATAVKERKKKMSAKDMRGILHAFLTTFFHEQAMDCQNIPATRQLPCTFAIHWDLSALICLQTNLLGVPLALPA
jgi:hypothetical protein